MTGVMTLAKLNKMKGEGCGMGRDEDYKPWIRIRRKQSSPVSNLYGLPSPLYSRPLQLLSGVEFAAANVAIWLGCLELREQHPLWPDPHPHPSTGRFRHPSIASPVAPGLLSLAKDIGVKHGVFPGTRLPYVATIDFTLEVGHPEETRLVHWSCKPKEVLEGARNKKRIWERIELERSYSRATGITHKIVDGTDFTTQLIGNLDWLCPLRSQLADPNFEDRMPEFTDWFMRTSGEPVRIAIKHVTERMKLEDKLARALFRACAWRGDIDIDPFEPVIMSFPLRFDTQKRKHALRVKLFGGGNV